MKYEDIAYSAAGWVFYGDNLEKNGQRVIFFNET